MAVDLTMPVLVVDDYNTMIRIIRNLLKQIGFQDIDDAADGTAALGKRDPLHFDPPASGCPQADAVLAYPLTFNSVNKFAHGYADNFAAGLLCEMTATTAFATAR